MNRPRIGKALGWSLLVLVIPVLLLTAAACGTDTKRFQGVLQDLDLTGNGAITIRDVDGEVNTLRIGPNLKVETAGDPATLEALVLGAFLEVDADGDTLLVKRILADQRTVAGPIVVIEGDEVTVRTARGRNLALYITETTRIRLGEDLLGTLENLREGQHVEITFATDRQEALRIIAGE